MSYTEIDAKKRDELDPFPCRMDWFDMPVDREGKQAIYLNGNSLGPKPKAMNETLMKACDAWGRMGVRGHLASRDPWVSRHETVAESLARLTGARPDEVVAMGTLTANIHFLFVSFYHPTPSRYKIIRLAGFPSDTYAIASQVKQRLETVQALAHKAPFSLDDAIIEIKPDASGYIDIETFKSVLDEQGESTAILWIEGIHYLTGQYFNMAEIARLAHEKGCLFGVDLAHAIGNVPLSLHDWNVDFAAWCSYKYLSVGPGGIAGLYVHENHLNDPARLRFAGWWGHNKKTRFQMGDVFDPIPTAESWLVSNSPIFLLAALRQSLDLFDQVDLQQLREKNKRLVAYLETLLKEALGQAVDIITPNNPDERGCQLSLRFKFLHENSDAENLFFEQGIICDVRKDLVRVAPMGLYTRFIDVFNFVEKLKLIFKDEI
ncbi:MAG TPA: kynureninase [Gammaproteobacteria bacterium]|nr:kynureninase [Gammaproteobacteria bacterium]